MRRILFLLLTSLVTGRLLAADQPQSEDELTKFKRDYADVLALEGTSKSEILAIARILRAKPEIAIDQTAASGEYCFNSGHGTMVHFATQPERTSEDIVYEFDVSGLIAAGLDPSHRQRTAHRRVVFAVSAYVMLSFYPERSLDKSRNRRNKLSSNSS